MGCKIAQLKTWSTKLHNWQKIRVKSAIKPIIYSSIILLWYFGYFWLYFTFFYFHSVNFYTNTNGGTIKINTWEKLIISTMTFANLKIINSLFWFNICVSILILCVALWKISAYLCLYYIIGILWRAYACFQINISFTHYVLHYTHIMTYKF